MLTYQVSALSSFSTAGRGKWAMQHNPDSLCNVMQSHRPWLAFQAACCLAGQQRREMLLGWPIGHMDSIASGAPEILVACMQV